MLRWLQTSLFGAPPDKPAARRISPARKSSAVELPDDPLFRSRWASAVGDPDITLELVPRLRQGWKLSWRRGTLRGGGGGALLRVPRVFADAPDETLRMLAAWTRLAMQRKTPARVAERRALEKTLHAWIEARHGEDAHAQKLRRGRAARRLDRLNAAGRHHDLEAILAVVVAEYFAGVPELEKARVTWSRRWGGVSTQTTAHDAHGNPYPLLSISRGYDHASATAEIVGGVVYHECLHVVVPPREASEGKGRRVVHGREFRRREKEYRFYDAWRKWHAETLPRIIRRGMPSAKRRKS